MRRTWCPSCKAVIKLNRDATIPQHHEPGEGVRVWCRLPLEEPDLKVVRMVRYEEGEDDAVAW